MKHILLIIMLCSITATISAQSIDQFTQAQCDSFQKELDALPDTKTLKEMVYTGLPLCESIPSHATYEEASKKHFNLNIDYMKIFAVTNLKYNISIMRNLNHEVKGTNDMLGGAGLDGLIQQFSTLLGENNPITQMTKGSTEIIQTGGEVGKKAGYESPAAKTFGIKFNLPKEKDPTIIKRHTQMDAKLKKMMWVADSMQTEVSKSEVEKRLEQELQDHYTAAILARFTPIQISAPSWEQEQEMEKIMAQIVRDNFFKHYVGPNALGLRELKKCETHWLKVYLPFMEEFYRLDGKVNGYEPDHYIRDVYAHAYINLCNNRHFVMQHTLLAISNKK